MPVGYHRIRDRSPWERPSVAPEEPGSAKCIRRTARSRQVYGVTWEVMLRKNVPRTRRVYGLPVRPSAHRKGDAGLRTRRRGRVPISLKAERRKSGEGAAFSPNIPASAFTAFPLFKNHAPNEDFLLYKEKKLAFVAISSYLFEFTRHVLGVVSVPIFCTNAGIISRQQPSGVSGG